MQVIRDTEFGACMIPLFVDWHHRSYARSRAAMSQPPRSSVPKEDESPNHEPCTFGICERHYNSGRGKRRISLHNPATLPPRGGRNHEQADSQAADLPDCKQRDAIRRR